MGFQILYEKNFILSNDPREREQNNIALLSGDKKHDVILISSLTNFNLEKLKNVIWKKLN